MLVNEFLLLGAVLFCIGVYGVIARKNAVMVLMSIELILNSVNINLLAFSQLHNNLDGNVFALYIIAVAAAEVGVGDDDRDLRAVVDGLQRVARGRRKRRRGRLAGRRSRRYAARRGGDGG